MVSSDYDPPSQTATPAQLGHGEHAGHNPASVPASERFSSHAFSSHAMDLQLVPGEVVAGKYYVDRMIGADGLGLVAHVRHVEIGRAYILKYIPAENCGYPEIVARFLRGARAAQGLQSEHTVRMVDAGRLDSGAPYAISELPSGAALREVLSVRGALSVTEGVDFILQACESLAEAHLNRVHHKNLSLSKLVLSERPDGTALVKVQDFGIAQALRADPLALDLDHVRTIPNFRTAHDWLGSAAPEQIRNPRRADGRADIWALGAVLHELLTGSPVFHAETLPGLLASIAADAPTPARALRSDIPPALEGVLLRALEKDPAARFPTLAELALALKPFALPDARNAADRVTRTLSRGAAETSAKRAMVRLSTPPPLPRPQTEPPERRQLPALPPPPPASTQPALNRHLPALLVLGGVATGALLSLFTIRMTSPLPSAPRAEPDATALTLQREIVREIAALRAAREDTAPSEESSESPQPARRARQSAPGRKLPLMKPKAEPTKTARVEPAAADTATQPERDEPDPTVRPTTPEAPGPLRADNVGAELFDQVH